MHLREADDCNSTTVPQDLDLGAHNHDFLGKYSLFICIYKACQSAVIVFTARPTDLKPIKGRPKLNIR